jgi:hypothetical protein
MLERAALVAAALWFGSLSMLGFVVVPALFAHLPSAAMAGQMAAKLFSLQAYTSAVCAAVVIVLLKPVKTRAQTSDFDENMPSVQVFTHSVAISFAITGLLLALLLEFAIAPRIAAREHLALMHGLGTGLYALQWVCAAASLWILSKKS